MQASLDSGSRLATDPGQPAVRPNTNHSGVAAAGGLLSRSLLGDAFDVAVFAKSAEGIGGEVAGGSPLSGQGAHILPEGAAEELFGGD